MVLAIGLRRTGADMARLPTRSVRFRVTGLATVIVAVLLTTVAVGLVQVQQRTLTAAVDDGLRSRADDLTAAIAEAIPVSLAGVDDDTAAQLVTVDGTVLVASPNLTVDVPIAAVPPATADVIAEVRVMGPDDTFRVLSRRVSAPNGQLVLYVATASDEVSDSVAILRGSLLLAIPLAVALLAAAIWWLVGRALQPVEAIRAEVDFITESDLNRRVPVPSSGDEIERLALTMNGMLDRVESGVARLQQFVADASHELRSPLTRIRSELEVDRSDPQHADLIATHQSVLEEALAMETLVDDLLYLARSDAGDQLIRAEPVDLDDLVLAEADRLQSESGVIVDVGNVSGGQVVGDRLQLKRAIRNLADNAVRYAAQTVTFAVAEGAGSVIVVIADDGPGIAGVEQERVFGRFARTDEGRSRDDGGTGLGLAIVRDIVHRHDGTITIDPEATAGTRFVIRLPQA